jgi:hypothetical protein
MFDQSKLVLDLTDKVEFKGKKVKGHLGQTEIYSYDIVNKAGEKKGSIQYTEHTNVRGLTNTYHTVQKDLIGNILYEEHK